ncbi:beta-lactamase/transpeptidase-like protein, partial [Mycena olivaceomarginata]
LRVVGDLPSGSINEDTIFWVCSQTKLITTIAALQLIECGGIRLDTLVETILPELVNPVVVTDYDGAGCVCATTPAKGEITLAAGSITGRTGKRRPMGSLIAVRLKFEPGTDFGYGFSTDCVGFIVERLSGKSLEQYFQDHIFAPLGITSASFYLTPPLKNRLLPLSFRSESGVIKLWKEPSVIEQDPAHVRVHFGGVGLYASQKDYLAVLHHLLQIQAGRVTNPILSYTSADRHRGPAQFRALHPPSPQDPRGSRAAQPWAILGLLVNTEDVPGRRRAGSGGWDGYATTRFFVDPTTGVAVVFATQILPTGDVTREKMYDALERELYVQLKARL